MKQTLKSILKKFPIIKQYLARMSNLEGSLRFEINKLQTELNSANNRLTDCRQALTETQEALKALKAEHDKTRLLLKSAAEACETLKAKDGKLESKISFVENRLWGEVKKQKAENRSFKDELKETQNDITYKYYKGLHPDSYEENIKEWYHFYLDRELDLENPQTYTQKMQWLKLYDVTPEKTRLTDKYRVREWIAEKIGEEYLIPLLGVWERFEDIDFDTLPDKFVLKANHGSGYNILVEDKAAFDKTAAEKKIKKWLNTNFAFANGIELQYKNIKPLIIAEKYMEGMDGLNDYKFMCFDGRVGFIWVDVDRFKGHKRAVYTTEWERMDVQITYPKAEFEIPKPENFDEMIKIAEKLSEAFCHVRVDLYNVNGKIYFGEMTFSSDSGKSRFDPEEFDLEVGKMLKLPKK